MAPTYKPLSMPITGLKQDGFNYGDIFMKSYNDQLQTNYQEAVNERTQRQADRDEIAFEKEKKRDEIQKEAAARVAESGTSTYSEALNIEKQVALENQDYEHAMNITKQQYAESQQRAKAAKEMIQLDKKTGAQWQFDPATGGYTQTVKGTEKASGGSSSKSGASLKNLVNPNTGKTVTVNMKDEGAVAKYMREGYLVLDANTSNIVRRNQAMGGGTQNKDADTDANTLAAEAAAIREKYGRKQ
jgi:hypothetical protein